MITRSLSSGWCVRIGWVGGGKRTWQHAVEGNGTLADEVLSDGVVVPHQEADQGQLGHVEGEDQRLLPHGVKPWEERGGGKRGREGKRGRDEQENRDGEK